MNIYQDWLPANAYYAFHLLAWIGGIVFIQWIAFPRLLWANRRAIIMPTLILGSYLIVTDIVAVHLGIWHFDEQLILAGLYRDDTSKIIRFLLKPFGVPLEEWMFFYITAILVAQSFVLFLPRHLRNNPSQ